MKKYILSLFVLFYFGVASGATVEFHYCMGKLVEWGMANHADDSDACSKCKMAESDSKECCKKEQQQVKVEKAQKAEFKFQFKVSPPLVAEPFNFELLNNCNFQKEVLDAHPGQAPPTLVKIPVFILLRTFRI